MKPRIISRLTQEPGRVADRDRLAVVSRRSVPAQREIRPNAFMPRSNRVHDLAADVLEIAVDAGGRELLQPLADVLSTCSRCRRRTAVLRDVRALLRAAGDADRWRQPPSRASWPDDAATAPLAADTTTVWPAAAR